MRFERSMGDHQQIWKKIQVVGMAATLAASLIGLSGCGAAGVTDGGSEFAMPTDPPAGDGPMPTADEVLEGMVAFMASQQVHLLASQAQRTLSAGFSRGRRVVR